MVKILLFICLLLLGCDIELYGDPSSNATYFITTTTHKPLRFEFTWIDDSLRNASATLLGPYDRLDCPDDCIISRARYALEWNGIYLDSLYVKDEAFSRIDSTLVELFRSIDSTKHLKFSLRDSADEIKSYDLDMAPVLSYLNSPKRYEIRGDSIDIFLPEGNFYVVYTGSCYNGIDDFNEFNKECRRYKASKDPQTITLEIAALGRLSYEIRYDFDEEDKMGEDTFTFKWIYYDAL